MKAVIAVQDTESGEIEMNVVFEGGFTIESNAHQHVNLMLKVFDAMAERRAMTKPETVSMDSLDDGIKSALKLLEAQAFTEHDPIPEQPMIKAPKIEVVRN